jgi:glycosyl transferase, family 25
LVKDGEDNAWLMSASSHPLSGFALPALRLDRASGLPIVYINLDDHTQRREAMQAEFDRLGIDAVRLSAVRWSGLPTAAQASLYSETLNARQYHAPLVAGEKGCYASHLLACRALLASPHPALVVLEDDVVLEARWPTTLRAIARKLDDVDIVKLIGRADENPRQRDTMLVNEGVTTQWIHFERVPSLTAAQVITRRGAEKLLKTRLPFGRPIDIDQRHWWENGLCIRGVVPAIVRLSDHSESSSIGTKADESATRVKWKKFRWKLAYSLRNAWHARLHQTR